MDSPLFSEGWTGSDELKLLDVIEEQGFGNWDSVGRRLCKSSEECYTHYNHYYITPPPPPPPSFLSESQKTFPSNYPGEDIPHYNPLRADFDIEPYNDAEKTLTISDLFMDNEEEEIIHQLLLGLVDSYWLVLKERQKRKSVIREHGLINVHKIQVKEKLLSEEEQSVRCSMRPFVRLIDSETTEKWIQSFLYEGTLIRKIKQLKQYRSLGIRSRTAIQLYERLKQERDKTQETIKKELEEIVKSHKSILPTLPDQQSRQTLPPLDISYSPGVNKLDEEEKQLCAVNRILPDVYLRCKSLILAENRKINGRRLKLMDARKLCRIDVNKTRKIYNLLLNKDLL